MRQVAHIMGTAVSLDIPSCKNSETFEKIFERLREIDERFSPYKASSEVSLFKSAKLPKPSPEFEEILSACQDWQQKTDGYFSAWAAGSYDPSGYVKGWVIAQAAGLIKKSGHRTFCIGIGGDILAASDSDKTWNIGIQNPFDRAQVIKKLQVKNSAVATSGNYERGAHIINPKNKKPADFWASITVAGADIITADVLATACFAAGENAAELISKWPEYDFIFIGHDGAVSYNPGRSR